VLTRANPIRSALAFIGSAAILVGVPAAADASYTLGATVPANESSDHCGSGVVALQKQTNGLPSYSATSDGVVVSWSYRVVSATAAPNLIFHAFRFVSSTGSNPSNETWFVRASSAQRNAGTTPGTVRPGMLNTFTESPGLKILTGDVIGLTANGGDANSGLACFENLTANDKIRERNPPAGAVGTNSSPWFGELANMKLGVSAVVEPDADGDSYGDDTQDSCTVDPAVHTGPCPVGDQDNDGVPNTSDNCPSVANPNQLNTDGDANGGDACDTDDDNDGVADGSDNCALVSNASQANNDGDANGGDACDADDDNDGVADTSDNCSFAPNSDQLNTDGVADGGNACDADDDEDGVPDGTDNCSLVANTTQTNSDGAADGGNLCDDDDDNDGVADADDAFPLDPAKSKPGDGQGGGDPDTDGDGLPNSRDQCPSQPADTANGCPAVGGPTAGNDVLNGDAAPNIICGLLGNDTINGLGGDDTLFGDACNATKASVSWTFGLGVAQAGPGGDDSLNGGDGNDSLYGAGGKDTLKGGAGEDKLVGGDGDDKLLGEAGRDSLDGGNGKDKLTGGSGVNSYKGGAGNDVVKARNGRRETIDCGAGKKDKATVDKRDVVRRCEKVRRAKK
jgi:Ca2+-binding RTX toxin-like protein